MDGKERAAGCWLAIDFEASVDLWLLCFGINRPSRRSIRKLGEIALNSLLLVLRAPRCYCLQAYLFNLPLKLYLILRGSVTYLIKGTL